jgi:hypothetical protein
MDEERQPGEQTKHDGRKQHRGRRLSPSSQIGRMQQAGGTPESRRLDDSSEPPDSDPWRAPREEDSPVEAVKPAAP